jgi:hypothetical protein
MSRSHAGMIPADAGDMTHAGAADMGSAKTTDATFTEATHVASAKAAHVASAKAAHMAATKTAATMSAAATATASGLRTRGNKAAGKQRSCQNHHPSSFHDLSPLQWAAVPPQDIRQTRARLNKANADVAIDSKMGIRLRSPY